MEDVATEHQTDAEPTGTEWESHETTEAADQSAATEHRPSLSVKRSGVETDDVFYFTTPAVLGRFDPSVGPVDVDLGNIPEGTYVSRKHAKIVSEDGVFKILDLGSSNGTFVLKNGDFERVEESELEDGLEIALGNARFVFHLA